MKPVRQFHRIWINELFIIIFSHSMSKRSSIRAPFSLFAMLQPSLPRKKKRKIYWPLYIIIFCLKKSERPWCGFFFASNTLRVRMPRYELVDAVEAGRNAYYVSRSSSGAPMRLQYKYGESFLSDRRLLRAREISVKAQPACSRAGNRTN